VIYLDNAATTLMKPKTVQMAVVQAMRTCASPGRGGYPAAERAAQVVFHTRTLASELFDCKEEQVVFTCNATHALNIAIASLVKKADRVIVSGFEHNAVMRPLYALGAQIVVAGRKLFDPADTLRAFSHELRKGAACVVCTHVSNVFGYVLPVEEIAELCLSHGVPLIVDASQSAGCQQVYLNHWRAAFVAMPGHKGLYGPQGTGILLTSEEAKPLLYGGTGSLSESFEMPEFLPDRLEAGTQNVAGIAGLGAGLEFVMNRSVQRICAHETHLRSILTRNLSRIPGVRCWDGPEGAQSGVVSFSVEGWDCEHFAAALAAQNVAVRAGLHCAPLAHESAGTLREGTIRASVGALNTNEDAERFVQIVKVLAKRNTDEGKRLAMKGF